MKIMIHYSLYISFSFSLSLTHTHRLFTEITSSQQALDYDKSRSRHSRQPPPADGEHTYIRTALQLLDLLDALYLRTGTVFKGIQEDSDNTSSASSMWHMCWCPLLEVY